MLYSPILQKRKLRLENANRSMQGLESLSGKALIQTSKDLRSLKFGGQFRKMLMLFPIQKNSPPAAWVSCRYPPLVARGPGRGKPQFHRHHPLFSSLALLLNLPHYSFPSALSSDVRIPPPLAPALVLDLPSSSFSHSCFLTSSPTPASRITFLLEVYSSGHSPS